MLWKYAANLQFTHGEIWFQQSCKATLKSLGFAFFLVNLLHIFITPFPKNTSGGLIITNPDIFLADAVSMRRKPNPALAVMTRRNNQRKIMEVCFFHFGLVVNFENCFNQFNVIYCIFNETIWTNFQQHIFWANQNQYFQDQRSDWYYSSKLWRAGLEQTLKYFVLKNIKR